MSNSAKLKKLLMRELRLTYFTAYGEPASRETFDGELNYQSGRLFFLVFIGLFVWLLYIPIDLQVHQFPVLATISRVGLSIISLCAILLRFTKTFRYKPKALMTFIMGYLYYATAFVSAIAGASISAYIGGFVFIIMLPIFAPFNLRFKIINTILSIALFYVLAFFANVSFLDVSILYSVADLLVVMSISILFSFGQKALQYRTWKQRIELSERDLREITRLSAEAEKIYYDPLTEIYNRRYFDENLEQALKALSRSNGNLSIMMIDIDYFKKYNDTYGHRAGDDCLKIVAKLLSDGVTRVDDFAARYGGEEFAVVLPNCDEPGARQVAEKLLDAMRSQNIPHKKNKAAEFFTFSIGVTTGTVEFGHTKDDYIKKADEMLYKSKQNGRNQYTFGQLG